MVSQGSRSREDDEQDRSAESNPTVSILKFKSWTSVDPWTRQVTSRSSELRFLTELPRHSELEPVMLRLRSTLSSARRHVVPPRINCGARRFHPLMGQSFSGVNQATESNLVPIVIEQTVCFLAKRHRNALMQMKGQRRALL